MCRKNIEDEMSFTSYVGRMIVRLQSFEIKVSGGFLIKDKIIVNRGEWF